MDTECIWNNKKSCHTIKARFTNLKLDFSDTYFIQIEHVNGSIGNLTVDVVSRQAVRTLEIFNEDLYLRWDGTPETLYEKEIEKNLLQQIPAGKYIHEKGYSDFINEYAYMKEIKEFFEVIRGKNPLYSFEKDKEILKLIYEIERESR